MCGKHPGVVGVSDVLDRTSTYWIFKTYVEVKLTLKAVDKTTTCRCLERLERKY